MTVRHCRIAAGVIALLLLAGSSVLADRLHLSSGGHVDVGRWWTEGDWIYYEGAYGVVGLPRSVVTRIETADGTETSPIAGSSSSASSSPSRQRSSGNSSRARSSSRDRKELSAQTHSGYEALRAREFELASRTFWDVLSEEAGLVGAQVGYALAEIALERDGMALRVVQDGLVQRPEQPALLELLGDLRNREERVEDALVKWRQANEIEPSDRLRDKIAKAEREIAAGRDYDLAATSHFTVRYDGDVDQALAGDVMDYLESQYLELQSQFRHGPPQPITVLLYPQREFREVTQSPDWVGGLYDGKIRVPLAGLSHLTGRAKAVLRHELAHAFIHTKTRGQCPRWLHEGLAQIVEGRKLQPADRREVARAVAKSAADGSEPPFSYPAALGFTRFLEKRRGFHGLIWVLDLLGEGTALDEALRQTYGLQYEALTRRWHEVLLQETR